MFFGGGFPPGFMPGGGMPGRGGGGGRERKPVNNTRYYELLEVSKDASESDIKKAYRRVALKEHPDKGGNEAKFKACTQAYEVLSNPEKRRMYDQFGEDADGLHDDSGGGGGMNPEDLFGSLFGGGGRRGGGQGAGGKRKGESIEKLLKVDLEDVYKGKTIKLAISRETICKSCSGSGGADGAVEVECRECRGQGAKVVLRQLGPGMVQQTQVACSACRGAGRSLPEGRRCKGCAGKKTVPEKKVLEVLISKGMSSGTRIVMRGEAGDAPGVEAGDIVFVAKVAEHPTFQRLHQHLLMEKDIPLIDALTGAAFSVKHLDGRRLFVRSAPGEIIQPGSFKTIAGAGMPLSSSHYRFGDLIVRFNVVFPPSGALAASAPAALKALLPRTMDAASLAEARRKRRAATKARATGRDEDEGGDDGDDDAGAEDDDGDEEMPPEGAPAPKRRAAPEEEGEDGAPQDEHVVLAPCASINAKVAEAREQAAEDKRHGTNAYDEEEEGSGGRQGVQCAQQ